VGRGGETGDEEEAEKPGSGGGGWIVGRGGIDAEAFLIKGQVIPGHTLD
jgi:hypothetical protein